MRLAAQNYPPGLNPSYQDYHQQRHQSFSNHKFQLSQPDDSYSPQPSPFFSGNDLDLDFGLDEENHSTSSSPASTSSIPSRQSNFQRSFLASFDSAPTGAVPREPQNAAAATLAGYSTCSYPQATTGDGGGGGDWEYDDSQALFASNDPMQTDPWYQGARLTPKSATRVSHNRESSLSSLGSAGPASPYSHNTANPQIAVTDAGDELHAYSNADDPHYQFAKSFSQEPFYANYPNYAPTHIATNATTHPVMPPVPYRQKKKNNRGLLPPPDIQNKSRPVSVASSTVSDLPATSSVDASDDRGRKIGFNSVPKLDRTFTDICKDELYNPNFNIASSSPGHAPVSPSRNDLFAQRLQAANSQHLSTAQSPASESPRGSSPFRQGSPLAPAGVHHDFPSTASPASRMGFGTTRQMREQRRAQGAQAVQQHLARQPGNETPQTISPKDAVLDFHSPEGDVNFPLFPQQESPGYNATHLKSLPQTSQSFDGMPLDASSFGNYVTTQLPANVQVPQQYPFIPQQPRQQDLAASMGNGSMAPSRLSSTESGQSEHVHNSPTRPTGTGAEGGTYTCTYHGCTLRFETPALLQKHKREGHRQTHGLVGHRPPPEATTTSGMTSSLLNSQAGPHRCDRINPSTGKPCNTVFSRPYDLTRHEDTIHNARKQKVRCNLCTDEKTFSRADALTRHYRVCHPDVELPGKHRRRGGQSV